MKNCPLCNSSGERVDWSPGVGMRCSNAACGFVCWSEHWEELPRKRWLSYRDLMLGGPSPTFLANQALFSGLLTTPVERLKKALGDAEAEVAELTRRLKTVRQSVAARRRAIQLRRGVG